MHIPSSYVGRFAPTPSGPLHAGSLLAALGSWLDARAHLGQWRMRIDDLDHERTRPGAIDAILYTLECHSLTWDGEVHYQSTQTSAYLAAIEALHKNGSLFACACTRKEVMASGGIYSGRCRAGLPTGQSERSLRLRVGSEPVSFVDRLAGALEVDLAKISGDFVVRRADGYIAYHLATVVDDAQMHVTDVVRGGDLLYSSAEQLLLCDRLHLARPRHAHLPLLKNAAGLKLSKQNHADPLDDRTPVPNLYRTLETLAPALTAALPPRKDFDDVESLLGWATQHWQLRVGLWPLTTLTE